MSCDMWHPEMVPCRPRNHCNQVTHVLCHVINHSTTSLLTSAALSALKTNRMLLHGPLEEKEKCLPDLVLQAILLLMNFGLPWWYNTLSKIDPRTISGVQNTTNLLIPEWWYHRTSTWRREKWGGLLLFGSDFICIWFSWPPDDAPLYCKLVVCRAF